jgi:hypothetical protein
MRDEYVGISANKRRVGPSYKRRKATHDIETQITTNTSAANSM